MSPRPERNPDDGSVAGTHVPGRLGRNAAAAARARPDHLDVSRGGTLYRVFLRADTLQVGISFWTYDEFRPTGPHFVLVFGEALDGDAAEPAPATQLVGRAWLFALHARSAIARGRIWQAEYMIGGMREQVIALACRRHDLPAVQGRGVDDSRLR